MDGQPSSADRLPALRAWALLGGVVAVIFARAPILLLEPRLWREEATVYLSYALQHSLLETLLLIPTSEGPAGYFNLAANLPAAVAANLLPLELAPWVSTCSALVVQLLPFLIVLFGQPLLWASPRQRALVCLVLLFSPALASEQIWLNSINSQVFCGLVAALLLVEDPAAGGRRWRLAQRWLLALCTLSGAYAALLAPAFLVRMRLFRDHREARVQALIAGLGAVVQGTVYVLTRWAFDLAPERFVGEPLAARLVDLLQHAILGPLLGETLRPKVSALLGLGEGLGPGALHGGHLRIVAWVAGVVLAGLVGWLWRRSGPSGGRLLVAALVSVTALTVLSIADLSLRGRYAAVPGTLLLLALLARAVEAGGVRRLGLALVVAVALVGGCVDFWRGPEAHLDGLGRAPGAPSWPEEVARWRRDPGERLRIWPYVATGRQGFALAPAEAFADVPAPLGPVQLIATLEPGRWSVDLFRLSESFRLVLDVELTGSRARSSLRVILRDGLGEAVSAVRLPLPEAGRRSRLHLPSWRLEPPARGRFDSVRELELELISRDGRPIRATVSNLRVAPRVEGALEYLVPPYGRPSHLAAAGPGPPATPDPGSVAADVYRGRLAAWLAALPAPGLALSALGLIAILAAVVAGGGNRRTLVVILLLASGCPAAALAGAGSMVTALLLFVAAAAFVAGGTVQRSPALVAVSGLAVGAVVVDLPAAAALAVAVAVHLLHHRRWRELGVLAGAVAVGAAVVALLPPTTGTGPGADGVSVRDVALAAWHLASNSSSGVLAFPLLVLVVILYMQGGRDQRRDLLFASILVLLADLVGRVAEPGGGSHVAAAAVGMATIYPLFLLLPASFAHPRVGAATVALVVVAALPWLNRLGPAPWVEGSTPVPAVTAVAEPPGPG